MPFRLPGFRALLLRRRP